MAFQHGPAAIVQEAVGNGRVVLVATDASTVSLDRSTEPPTPWSALATWPSFPPLVHQMLRVVVTGRRDWANGVLLRALQLPGEPERTAAGPGLLARRFGLDRRHDGLPVEPASGLWIAPRRGLPGEEPLLTQTTRIGISQGLELPWRWYLRHSPSVSRRAPGDRRPRA